MTGPTISIAMATYNGAKYIRRQLDCLAAQTYLPCEVVVCDDGSTDSTVDILERFAATAPFPVRIYANTERLGYADNFLKAASVCKGDWTAFCDQDDVWLREKLELCTAPIQKYPDVVYVAHSADLVNADLEPLNRRVPDFPHDCIRGPLESPPIEIVHGFCILFKTSLVRQFDFCWRPHHPSHAEMVLSHDIWITLLANAVGRRAYLSRSLALYRRHDGAVSGTYDTKSLRYRIRATRETGFELYARRSSYLLQCASKWRELSLSGPTVLSPALKQAAAYYSQRSELYYMRAGIYVAPIPHAIGCLISLARRGGYSKSRKGEFRLCSACKDLAVLTARSIGFYRASARGRGKA